MPRSSRILTIALVLAAGMILFYFGTWIPQVRSLLAARHLGAGAYYGNDFYPIWFAAHALDQRPCNPYSDALTRQIEAGIYGRPLVPALRGDPRRQYRGFSYPLYVEFFAWPLARLSFEQTQVLLTALFLPLMALAALLWLRAIGVSPGPVGMTVYLLFYLTSFPALEAIFALQPSIVVAVCLAGMSLALVRGRYLIAGILIALASIKPQLTVLLTAWLLAWSLFDWKRRRLLVFGFSLSFGALLVGSEWIDPGWISVFVHTVGAYRQYTAPPLVQLIFGPWLGAAPAVFLLALAAHVCWRTRHFPPERNDFQLTLAIVLAVTITLFPTGAALYDHLLLMPAWLWLYKHRAMVAGASVPLRWLFRLLLAALAWQWIAALGVALLVAFLPALRSNTLLGSVPVRLQLSLPFITIALLGLMAARSKSTNPHSQPQVMPSLG
jgi:hypothetical protein